jgi:pyruvate-ferredoxin/flavodoxin oxidoreductase
LEHLHEVSFQRKSSTTNLKAPVSAGSPDFVEKVLGEIIAGRGDDLPVSVFPVDGTFPTGTAQYEKRNISH